SGIRSEGFCSLFDGAIVELKIEFGSDGRTKAVDVTGPDGASFLGGTWSSAEYEYSSSGQSVVQLESCLRQKVGEAAEYSTNQKRRGCLFIG
uniref:Glycine-rich protein 2 n=1 Tax=Solanum tuberosum TaxID=4113 RepID=M1B1P9_SOLTU